VDCSMPTNNSLRLVAEREIPDTSTAQPAPQTSQPPAQPKAPRPRAKRRFKIPAPDVATTIAALNAAAMILNARVLLLLGLIVAAGLGYLAVSDPKTPRLVAAGIFNVLIFLPLVALYLHKGGNA
jgi:hypothetical protein